MIFHRTGKLSRVVPAIALSVGYGLALALSLLAPLEAAVPVGPFFNNVFPDKAPGGTAWGSVNAFPNLTFVDPLWMKEIPGSSDVLVVEKGGRFLRFPNNSAALASQVKVVLDLTAKIQVSEDQGAYRLAFHPKFGQSGSAHANDVFVTYSHRPQSSMASPDRSMWRLSRFTWQPASGTIDPASESVLIQQYDPHRWHNGGGLEFDNSGFLLVVCGDGGGANAEFDLVQKLDGGFFGGVLRIDVDNNAARSNPIVRQPVSPTGRPADFPQSFSQGYRIPKDNPWMDASGKKLQEFYALGLRSPHGFSYDRNEGKIWIGDVGQDSREEVNIIGKGANCQWPYREGDLIGPKGRLAAVGTETPPLYSYGRETGGCVIGGFLYDGLKWRNELGKKYIFADNSTGRVSALTREEQPLITELYQEENAYFYIGIANICTDSAGEIYILKLNGQSTGGATIRKLVVGTTPTPSPPSLLSATGLFSDTAALIPSPALRAYEVASPLWSDGATKKRWIAIPNDGAHSQASEWITYSDNDNWRFPSGTVFVKHFEMPVDARTPWLVRRLETRVMICTGDGGKYGVTYRWNEAGTDAVLLSGSEEQTFGVTKADGSLAQQRWTYPSRADCMQCHTTVSGQALGLRTHQVNLMVKKPDTKQFVNQLELFNNERLFSEYFYLPIWGYRLEARSPEDVSAPLEHRVRSYLDSNCSQCHQPGGTAPFFDARLQTPLKEQGLINAILRGQFQLPGGRYINPGDTSLSAIHTRMASNVPGIAMPPLGKHLVDSKAVAMLTEYISSLNESEFEATPAPTARFVRFTGSPYGGGALTLAELSVLDPAGTKIPTSSITISAVSSQATGNGVALVNDGDPWTFWSTTAAAATSASFTMDLGNQRAFGGVEYVPRQDSSAGRAFDYSIEYSADGIAWFHLGSANTWQVPKVEIVRFENFVNRRPVRASIAAATHSVAKDFPVTIVFDSPVTDFDSNDLQITGGEVIGLRGGGYYYVATIRAEQPHVTVMVPKDGVNVFQTGNRASSVLTIESQMEAPPVPSYTSASGNYSGPFEVGIKFDRPHTGFAREDLIVTEGTIEWMIPDGDGWRLIIVPSGTAQISVQLREGSVVGTSGLPSAYSSPAYFYFQRTKLEIEAEVMSSRGFITVSNPEASGGNYRWTEKGVRKGITSLQTNYSMDGSFEIAYPGNYRLRAWTRADEPTSDSFHVSLLRSQKTWQVNRGPGEIGSGNFHSGFAGDNISDYVYTFPPGPSFVSIYAAEDGTMLDKLALIPARPLGFWTGPKVSAALLKTASIHFSSPVTGLTVEDFETLDGAVTGVSGSGQDYTVTLKADKEQNGVCLKENSVIDEFGAMNLRSEWFVSRTLDTYAQWTSDRGLSVLPASDDLDTDFDGIGQLMEYALGLDPLKPDSRPINPSDPGSRGVPSLAVVETEAGRRLSLIFDRRRSALWLDYFAEFTGDFSDYTSQQDFTGQIVPVDAQWERVTVPDSSATGKESSRFGRLRIERKK